MLVIFLDLLGFAEKLASLTEEDQLHLIDALRRSSTSAFSDLFRLKNMNLQEIYDTFIRFNKGLEKYYWEAHENIDIDQSGRISLVSGIIFSDSAFMVFDDATILQHFARGFMGKMYDSFIPVRCGVGLGSFGRLNFSAEYLPTNNFLIRSPFMGSAIVNAYRAESCGLKGLRVFVHPSAVEVILTSNPNALIELPRNEQRSEASHEFIISSKAGLSHYTHQLEIMQDRSPESVMKHYTDTHRALRRMGKMEQFF
jgi:hypothetical protein